MSYLSAHKQGPLILAGSVGTEPLYGETMHLMSPRCVYLCVCKCVCVLMVSEVQKRVSFSDGECDEECEIWPPTVLAALIFHSQSHSVPSSPRVCHYACPCVCVCVCRVLLPCEFIAVFDPLAPSCTYVFLLEGGRGERSLSVSSTRSHQTVLCGRLSWSELCQRVWVRICVSETLQGGVQFERW